jgi:tRNA (guanine37-N1)-methyltransferase
MRNMNIDILTIFPQIFQNVFSESIIKRAIQKNKVSIGVEDIRQYSHDKHRRVDDYPYGGQAGMVMMPQPIVSAIESLKTKREYDEVIFFSPDGELFNQQIANELSMKNNMLLLCGHYKGVDQRVRDHWVTREISVGDYVLSGGEIPAMMFVDAIVRLIPGVLGDETSALSDSFQNNLLSPPVYTRPSSFKGFQVPSVLLSGNDRKIEEWKIEQALARTEKLRPHLLKKMICKSFISLNLYSQISYQPNLQ